MCHNAIPLIHGVVNSRRTSFRLLTLFLAAVLVAVGCSGKGAKNSVTGKVTMNGQPVKGTVVFLGANSEKQGGIEGDGTYYIQDPPLGEVTVLIKAYEKGAEFGGGGGSDKKPEIPQLKPTKEKGVAPDTGGRSPSLPEASGGVNPPAKYGKKDSSPLKITVKGSVKEKHDFTLEK
jgi:hypothetical protein